MLSLLHLCVQSPQPISEHWYFRLGKSKESRDGEKSSIGCRTSIFKKPKMKGDLGLNRYLLNSKRSKGQQWTWIKNGIFNLKKWKSFYQLQLAGMGTTVLVLEIPGFLWTLDLCHYLRFLLQNQPQYLLLLLQVNVHGRPKCFQFRVSAKWFLSVSDFLIWIYSAHSQSLTYSHPCTFDREKSL